MLRSYFRARSGPGGDRLIQRGVYAVVPVAKSILVQIDSAYSRFTQGEIEVTEIVPGLERAVFWLTAAYESRTVAR